MMYIFQYTTTTTIDSFNQSDLYDELEAFQDNLIVEVCKIFGVDRKQLYTNSRVVAVKYCRWIVWEIIYALTGKPMVEIGKIFGSFDHTTIGNALTTLQYDLSKDKWLSMMYDSVIKSCKIDMVIINELRERRSKAKKICNPSVIKHKISQAKRISLVIEKTKTG